MPVFDTAETNRLLDATFSVADYVGATTGSQLRLATTDGNDTTPGTSVTGGSYTPQAMAMSAAASRSISNADIESFTLMPATTVISVEIYNSGGTVRKAYGGLTVDRTTAAGDTLSFAVGSIVCTYT